MVKISLFSLNRMHICLCVCTCAVQIVYWLVWVCLNLLAGAVTCLWLNIHVPSGRAHVCSCLTPVSICSNMLPFVHLSVFCLYSPNTQTLLIHTYCPCLQIAAWAILALINNEDHAVNWSSEPWSSSIVTLLLKYLNINVSIWSNIQAFKIQSGFYIDIVREGM